MSPRRSPRSPKFFLVALAVALISPPAGAADPEHGTVRLGYGVAYRHGGQADTGPGLSYRGYSPNNLWVEGWYFWRWIGAAAYVERESFALLDATGRVTGGTVARGNVGPAFRIPMGPARLEVTAAYQLAQLPLYALSSNPVQRRGQRQAVLIGGRAVLDVPWRDFLEVRGEYPIVLDVRTSDGALGGRAPGFTAGAGFRAPLFTAGAVSMGLVLSYRFSRDTLYASDGRNSSQYLNRYGLSIDVSFVDPAPPPVPPTTGNLAVKVTETGTDKVPAGLELALVEAPETVLTAREDGAREAKDLKPGELTVRASAPGYEPKEAKVNVVVGEAATLSLSLDKEIPKVGTLEVLVVERSTNVPVPRAEAKINNQAFKVEPGVPLRLAELPVGPIAIEVKAPGFKSATETANVIGGQTASVTVVMVRAEVRLPATVSGIIRSTETDEPVAALLEIPEVRLKLRADDKGAFATQIKGGTYRVIISAPGFRRQVKTFSVKDGDQAIFNVDLYPAKAKRGRR